MHKETAAMLNYQDAPIRVGEVIMALIAQQARFSDHLDRCWDDLDPAQLARLLSLYGQTASRLGRLLRDHETLYNLVSEEVEDSPRRLQEDSDDDTYPQDGKGSTIASPPSVNAAPLAGDSTLTGEHPPDDDSSSDYSFRPLPIQIDDLIADLAAKQSRLSRYLDQCWQDPEAAHLDRLLAVYSQNATRLGRLLRHRYAIYGPPPDPFGLAINQALDQLSEEWGIDL